MYGLKIKIQFTQKNVIIFGCLNVRYWLRVQLVDATHAIKRGWRDLKMCNIINDSCIPTYLSYSSTKYKSP